MSASLKTVTFSFLFFLLLSAAPIAYGQSFSDVPTDHPAFDAIEALKEAGVLRGYSDGTFKPNKGVNRAEAIKIIVAPLLTAEQIAQAQGTVYTDVPADAWYIPYIEWARQGFGIIDGPPEKTVFHGGNPVILAEFLKMLELANGIKPTETYANITLPLANDVTDASQWYYPYIRYAITASMLDVDENGRLNPARQLTRSDTALLLYHFLLNKQSGRTQVLLNQAERNIMVTLQAWDQGLLEEAEYASARALLAARGANTSQPTEAVTKGAVKVAEAFRALVRGYRAGVGQDFAEAERLSGEAWNLSKMAVAHSDSLTPLADQIKAIAKTMADSARASQR